MMDYIEKEKLMELSQDITTFNYETKSFGCFSGVSDEDIAKTPIADVVEVETIKAWLYEIAINNIGYVIDGDFFNACEEIISRLDGLRNFAKECTSKERGGEK